MSRTAFGNLLTHFQKEKALAIEKARMAIWKKNQAGPGDNYRLAEGEHIGKNGEIIHTIQLWQLVDESHTKVQTGVTVETLGNVPVLEKADTSDGFADLLS